MNWQQLAAVLRLRWQISRNEWRKAGTLNAIIMMFLAMMVLASSVFVFFGAAVGGYLLLPHANADHLLLAFDAAAGLFLIAWFVGLLIELQRSELLSLDKLLHLPVSLWGAFLLNYFSSWFCFSIAMFVPLAAGLSLALVATRGPAMLLAPPLFAGFLIMVTGATYQLRGWLARLMENKRRRGTILMAITFSFIALSQAPSLINLAYHRTGRNAAPRMSDAARKEQEQRLEEMRRQLVAGEITNEEFTRAVHDANEADATARPQGPPSYENALQMLRWANVILPIGWLPFGVHTLAQGRLLPAFLGSAGMFALGMFCLYRSYVGTMKAYTGENSRAPAAAAIPAAGAVVSQRTPFVARDVPFVSPAVSTVALASLISVIRSPEGKMMLMSPLGIMGFYGAFLVFGPAAKVPEVFVTPIAILSIGVALLSLLQLLFNAFGFDRSGFRAYILMPVERRNLIYGKNLSLLPVAVGLNVLLLCLMEFVLPLPVSHLPATMLQMIVAYLLMCLIGNLTSIYAPTMMQSGSVRMNTVRALPLLLQFLCTMLLPLTLLPAAAAWGAEFLIEYLTDFRLVPWYLILSVAECALVVFLYVRIVAMQESLLFQRETRILEVVAGANE